MKRNVELSAQEAKLVVQALFELGIESKYTMADRINRKVAKAFNKNDKWLGDVRLS